MLDDLHSQVGCLVSFQCDNGLRMVSGYGQVSYSELATGGTSASHYLLLRLSQHPCGDQVEPSHMY